MSWGKGIALTLFGFVLFMTLLVYKSSRLGVDLVSKTYYEDSLDYDQVQEKRINYAALDEEVLVNLDKQEGVLEVTLPAEFHSPDLSGTVYFYNPADAKRDLRVSFEEADFHLPLAQLGNGLWKVHIDWTYQGRSYLYEQVIVL